MREIKDKEAMKSRVDGAYMGGVGVTKEKGINEAIKF